MQIVIDIPEGLRDTFKHEEQWTSLLCADMRDALAKGIVLPKGHGRLIDADKFDVYILKDKSEEFVDGAGRVLAQIDDAPTVLEADKE